MCFFPFGFSTLTQTLQLLLDLLTIKEGTGPEAGLWLQGVQGGLYFPLTLNYLGKFRGQVSQDIKLYFASESKLMEWKLMLVDALESRNNLQKWGSVFCVDVLDFPISKDQSASGEIKIPGPGPENNILYISELGMYLIP